MTSLKTVLKLRIKGRSKLDAEVATIILDEDDPETYIRDVLAYGCINGNVSELIYYADTWRFLDRHYQEIEQLRWQWEDKTGEAMTFRGKDLKNELAWFAFETVVADIAREAGID